MLMSCPLNLGSSIVSWFRHSSLEDRLQTLLVENFWPGFVCLIVIAPSRFRSEKVSVFSLRRAE